LWYRSSISTHQDEDVEILCSADSQCERLPDQIIAGDEKTQANTKDEGDVRRSVQEPRPLPGEKHLLCLGTYRRRFLVWWKPTTPPCSADPSTL